MSELTVGSISGLAANNYVVDVAAGSQLTQPGMVLQVVSEVLTDQLAINSESGVEIMSATINPSSASSKILLTLSIDMHHVDFYTGFIKINRNGVNISPSPLARPNKFFLGLRSAQGGFATQNAVSYTPETITKSYLDSPSTASAVTYSVIASVPGALTAGYNVPLYVNRTSDNANDTVNNSGFTTLTLMEIAQ